tara:strand:- start:454 stop:1557 length:1104 start_codon:yes stop_codon:yes gene_type:complete
MNDNDIKSKFYELLENNNITKDNKINQIIQSSIKKEKYNILKLLFSLIGNHSKIDIDCNKIKGKTLNTTGDGNCLFHAVIGSYLELTGDNLEKHVLKDGNFIQVFGNETAENMRKNVGEWYEINKDKNIPIVDKGVDMYIYEANVCPKCNAKPGSEVKKKLNGKKIVIIHPSLDKPCPLFTKERESNTEKRTLFEELKLLYNTDDVNKHINKFKTNNNMWGDNTSIYAISDIYKIQIYVCNDEVFKNNSYDANNLDTYQLFKNSESGDIGFKNKNDILNGIKIFIHFNNKRSTESESRGNHYQSIKITDEIQKKILINKLLTIKDKIFKLLIDKKYNTDTNISSLMHTSINLKAYTVLVNLFDKIKK